MLVYVEYKKYVIENTLHSFLKKDGQISRTFLVCKSCMCLIVLAEMYRDVVIDLIWIDLQDELTLQVWDVSQKCISSRTSIIHE